jgi:hypothetical protein
VTGCSGKDNAETQRALGSQSLRGSALNGGLVFGVGSAGRGKPPLQEIEADLGDRVSCRLLRRQSQGARLL